MATAEDVIRIAEKEVGYNRWDDPLPGTKYGRWYAGITGSPYFGESGVPYCAMFVSWVLAQAGAQCEGFPRAVAIDRRDGFTRMVEPSALKPADPVGFDWGTDRKGDHVGIVVDRSLTLAVIDTYEGNTGNGQVLRCVRPLSQCTIGVRPYYDESSNPAKDAGLLDVDGVAGPNTIYKWQEDMRSGADGKIDDQPAVNDRWHRNVWVIDHGSGEDGSPLIRSVQWVLAGKGYDLGPDGIDGLWGYYFTGALQSYLKKLGYYTGGIDHDFAQHSVKALQKSINDGKWKQ